MVLKERVGKSGLHEGTNPLKSTDQCPFCLWLESRVHASSITCNTDKLHTHTHTHTKKKRRSKQREMGIQASKQTKKRKHANKQRNKETHIDICNKCGFGL